MAGIALGPPKPAAAPTPQVKTIAGQDFAWQPGVALGGGTSQPGQRVTDADGYTQGFQENGGAWTAIKTQGGAGAALAQRAAPETPGESFDAALVKAQSILPQIPPRETLPPQVKGPSQADRRAGESAAFARAKDRIGMTSQGAGKSLRALMSRRGLAGSGIEAGELGNLVSDARGQLGDVIRDQSIEGLRRDQAVEDRNYAGDISQRTTDMGFNTGQRGQDINAEIAKVSQLPSLIALMMRGRTGAAY
jgi:hypothetical protein